MRHAPVLIVAAVGLTSSFHATEPVPPIEVVTPKDDGIIATGINSRGEVIGFEWIESRQQPGVVEQIPFFARGKTIIYLPLLETYTATFPAAVSDDGQVVGRSSKPGPRGVRIPLRNQAFVWDARTGIHGLGTLLDDWASFACGISRDGCTISGFSVGDNRVRACVWTRENKAETSTWKLYALPQSGPLGSNTVPLSDSGGFAAAVDRDGPCLWTCDDSDRWSRETIDAVGSFVPRAVNNTGTVVGLSYQGNGQTLAVLWTRGEGVTRIEPPPGFVRSEALAINNDGAVVGMVDGPHGSKLGPHAFIYERSTGRFQLIVEASPTLTAATAINDRRQVAGVFEKEVEDEPAAAAEPSGKAR